MSACHGCGSDLPPKTWAGRDQKWCSDRCRKITLYSKQCIDCGAACNTDGSVADASVRCRACSLLWQHVRRRWTPGTIIAAIQRWAEEHGGVPPAATDWNATLAVANGRPARTDDFPATTTVISECGTWASAIRAAGFDAFAPGQCGRDGEDPAVVAETVALYRSGLSLKQVGERMGVSGSCILQRLRTAGEPRRTFNEWREQAAA